MLQKNEKDVNIQMGNTYCKVKKSLLAAGELPEGRTMRYAPSESTSVITQTSKRKAKLQKNRLIHQWHQDQHHSIPFWGLNNIY